MIDEEQTVKLKADFIISAFGSDLHDKEGWDTVCVCVCVCVCPCLLCVDVVVLLPLFSFGRNVPYQDQLMGMPRG